VSYYLRQHPGTNRPFTEAWKINDVEAYRLGIINPTVFRSTETETIWDVLRTQTGWFGPNGENPFHKTRLQPGAFYPRMARPPDLHPHESAGSSPSVIFEKNYMAMARGQLTVLIRQLNGICQTVHPIAKTFDTFGHDIRNLLILACTEVETHCRGVLVTNGVNKEVYNSNDYVLLRDAMRLEDYAIDFPAYPWLQPIKPFEGWGRTGKPSRDLKWYAAYNAVKHNREHEFEQATLGHAFEAVTAAAIMIVAQFGHPFGLGPRTELQDFFHLAALPAWPLSEVYIHSYGEGRGAWEAVPYPFQPDKT
jgi:hypothetical protein